MVGETLLSGTNVRRERTAEMQSVGQEIGTSVKELGYAG